MRAQKAAVSPETFVTVIVPTKGWVGLQLRELWAFRELLYFLTWREIKVRAINRPPSELFGRCYSRF